MADIFVSYASEDRDRVEPLVKALEAEGWTIWWAPVMHAGPRFDKTIDEALEQCSCVIAVWSQNSVNSDFVIDETTEGRERGILVPLRIDDVRPPLGFRSAQTANLVGWPEQPGDFNSLLSGVRALVGDVHKEPPLSSIGSALPETSPSDDIQSSKRRWLLVATIAAVIGLVAFSIFQYQESASQRRWATEEGLPEAERLAANGFNIEADAKALELDKLIPENPGLVVLWLQISEIGSLHSEPSGADVVYRPYSAPDTEWTSLGATPLENIRLPRGALVYKIDSAGYSPAHIADMNPGRVLGNEFDGVSLSVTLTKSVPPDQIYVPAVTNYISLHDFPGLGSLPERSVNNTCRPPLPRNNALGSGTLNVSTPLIA